jgi:hypothetical protein
MLYEPDDKFVFVCYSDDATFSIDYDGQLRWYNSDINSADASYTPALFQLLVDMFPTHVQDDVKRLVNQCKLPMKIFSTNDMSLYVVLQPLCPVLYSGSTLTTILNTLANMVIAQAISLALSQGRIQTEQDIVTTARDAGFLITLTECATFEQVQFLKHSPVRDINGCWQPLLNFGVLLRASGMCLGDLPGTGDIATRALEFQRGLLRGAYPYASFTLLRSMWSAVGQGRFEPLAFKEFTHKVVDTNKPYPPYIADDESFRRRYDLTPLEFDYCREVLEHGYGWSLHSSGLSKILTLDYDLQCSEYTEQRFFFHK